MQSPAVVWNWPEERRRAFWRQPRVTEARRPHFSLPSRQCPTIAVDIGMALSILRPWTLPLCPAEPRWIWGMPTLLSQPIPAMLFFTLLYLYLFYS